MSKLDQGTQRIALRKLLILDAADVLGDLRVPPGNRLEKQHGHDLRLARYFGAAERLWLSRACVSEVRGSRAPGNARDAS